MYVFAIAVLTGRWLRRNRLLPACEKGAAECRDQDEVKHPARSELFHENLLMLLTEPDKVVSCEDANSATIPPKSNSAD